MERATFDFSGLVWSGGEFHLVYSRYVSHRRDTLLSFSPPAIGDEEIAEVVAALRSGWITTGPRTRIFEQAFAGYIGASAALALNSATGALHVALAALGVGPGTPVITSALTFPSGVHVIEHVGARPVLVDVEPDTLNIDPVQVTGSGWPPSCRSIFMAILATGRR
jgi:dTDP-4-amino-4,6-dideoxygalactose transaminase